MVDSWQKSAARMRGALADAGPATACEDLTSGARRDSRHFERNFR
jgi:hypothetical protein